MKKLIAMAIVLCMVLGMIPMIAMAAGDYYVAGDAALCGENWACDDANNKMTAAGGNIYTKVYTNVAAGTYSCKVTDGTWTNSWGDNGQNYTFKVTSACDVTITFDSNAKTVKATGSGVGAVTGLEINALRVAGNGADKAGWLNGAGWDITAAANTMTANGNVYTITYEDVPVGTGYQFKFVANENWGTSWGGSFQGSGVETDAWWDSNNITFDVTGEAQDVTLKLDLTNFDYSSKNGAKFTVTIGEATGSTPTPTPELSTEKVTVHVQSPWAAPHIYSWMAVEGSASVEASGSWPGTAMTADPDNANWYTYQVSASVDNIIINGGQDQPQTVDLAVEAGEEVWIVVGNDEQDGNKLATVTYTAPSTEGDGGDEGEQVGEIKYVVVGDLPGTGEWEPADSTAVMTESDGVYSYTFENLAAAEKYELKVVKLEGTNATWIPDGMGNNITFTVTAAGDVTVTYEAAEGVKVEGDNVTEYVAPQPESGTYLIGFINGADYSGTDYKFVDGKVTVTFAEKSYVFLSLDGNHYMTADFIDEGTTEGAFVAASDVYKEKMAVPAGEVTFTLTQGAEGSWILSYTVEEEAPAPSTTEPEETEPDSGAQTADYYLVGYINGADYGIEADSANLGEYKFVNGKLSVKFTADSYVIVKTGDNTNWYLAEAYCTDTTVVLHKGASEKLFVPGNVDITFTLVENNDGTLTLSYVTAATGDDSEPETSEPEASEPEASEPETDAPAEVTEITVYAKVPEDWQNPGVWAWNDKQENAFEAWPGLAMTQGENGWWYAKVPAWVENVIINANNGSYQTADLDLAQLKVDVWVEVTVDENGQAQVEMKYASPATGDETALVSAAAVMLIAAMGVVAVVKGKKFF